MLSRRSFQARHQYYSYWILEGGGMRELLGIPGRDMAKAVEALRWVWGGRLQPMTQKYFII